MERDSISEGLDTVSQSLISFGSISTMSCRRALRDPVQGLIR